MELNAFQPIYGAKEIAKFMGISKSSFDHRYATRMGEAQCIWKKSGKKSSKWMTTPIFVALFFMLDGATSSNKEK